MIVKVLLEAGPPNWGAVASEGLSGVVTATADTRDDVVSEFKSALKFHIEGLRLEGLPVPVVDGLEIRELLPVEDFTPGFKDSGKQKPIKSASKHVAKSTGGIGASNAA